MHLLLSFDVCRPSVTEDINILELVILLTLSWSKMMISLLTLGRSSMTFISVTLERLNSMIISLTWPGWNNSSHNLCITSQNVVGYFQGLCGYSLTNYARQIQQKRVNQKSAATTLTEKNWSKNGPGLSLFHDASPNLVFI